ncbi:MAG: putative transport system permease protein [Solirubrobacteraceae bacterium]|jgi:putative ABC transport system permease protein|nr:putative transport system permease protein [Solirubrobacteraceae bacterium]
MIRLTLRGIAARRLRSALTAVAVLLGVTMISGTLVLNDTIDRAVSRAVSTAARGSDAVVSGRAATSAAVTSTAAPKVPQSLLARIQRLHDVERAQGEISDVAEIVRRDGTIVSLGAGGTRALSYVGAPFQAVRIVAGRQPISVHDVVVDQATATALHLRLRQRLAIATERPKAVFRVVGFMKFGGAGQLGTILLAFSLPAAQHYFLKPGQFDYVDVAGRPGVSPQDLVGRIAPLLGPRFIVRTAADQARQDTNRIFDELSFLTSALLAFGLIAVFVGAFVIFNTFSITVTQRTSELGLLRTLGATRRQLLGSVLAEALAIGAVGSALATGLGFVSAAGIRALLDGLGLQLPNTSPVLAPRTVLVSMGVGLAVTVFASLVPALRATRVPPIAAMREGVRLSPSALSTSVPWLALGLGLLGLLLTVNGLVAGHGVGETATGAVALTLGVAILTPKLIPLAARAAGFPFERSTTLTGRLARENASRNPGRTAATASALTIGLALVIFVTIFATETRSAIREVVAHSFAGDLAVTNQDGYSPIPVAAAAAVANVPGVQVTSVLKRSDAKIENGGSQSVNGIDTQSIGTVYTFNWVSGDNSLLGFLGPNGALVENSLARSADLQVGSHFLTTTPSGKQTELTVRGIYQDRDLLPGFAVSLPTFNDLFHELRAQRVLVKVTPGADVTRVQRKVNNALAPFPQTRALDVNELQTLEANSLNSILSLFYALLAISVFVSVFGIVNTLQLSIHERRRELGVLRALGASRRAVRRMVRYESVITATIGGALGLSLGIFFAAVVTAALDEEGLHFQLPWLPVVGLLALAVVLGVLAAIGPARRASRLDVLGALAHDR